MQRENTTVIEVTVRSDTTPELAERYTLTLDTVRTLSDSISSGSGAAILDPQASTATITIGASNNPHGQIDFQASSLFVTSDEGQMTQLTIIRQFGTFGECQSISEGCSHFEVAVKVLSASKIMSSTATTHPYM